jgi:hypothetical protein
MLASSIAVIMKRTLRKNLFSDWRDSLRRWCGGEGQNRWMVFLTNEGDVYRDEHDAPIMPPHPSSGSSFSYPSLTLNSHKGHYSSPPVVSLLINPSCIANMNDRLSMQRCCL